MKQLANAGLYTCRREGKCTYSERFSNRCIYCGKTADELLEYSMKIPYDIFKMAIAVEDWFIKNNIKKWRLMGMVSRNHLNELNQYKEKIEEIKRVANNKIYE